MVYLASNMLLFGSPQLTKAAETIRRTFPNATILRPEVLYADHAAWRQAWPRILPTLDALVFVTLPGGWIGYGTAAEIRTAQDRRVPMYQACASGRLVAVQAVAFSAVDPSDWHYYCRVQVTAAGHPETV